MVEWPYDDFADTRLPPPGLWPELVFDLPALQYPEILNCGVALLQHAVDRPDHVALVGAGQTLTYRQLQEQVNRVSNVLRDQLHLVPGNRVLLRGPNNPMLVVGILAVWQTGCIAIPSMPMLRARELALMLDKAQINAALCSADLLDELVQAQAQAVSPVLRQIVTYGAPDQAQGLEQRMQGCRSQFAAYPSRADQVCLISFTSGTTGVPKATMHFHRDVLAICDCFPVSTLKCGPEDVFIGTPPLAFTFGLGGLVLFPLRVGATGVLLEKYTPDTLLAAIERYRATICFTAPTFYRQMLPGIARFNLASLKKTVSAGEALPVATRSAWLEATGLNMIDGIGATEMLHIFISAADQDIRPGATGRPIPGYRACILDPDGQPVGPGVVGRLAVKGPTGCRYLDDARQSSYVVNGWNVTGDAYKMDQDGYFWYQARTDDMIISAGYNIAAPEVEEVLLLDPAVAECAVVGVPDPERGQLVVAYVVLHAGNSPDAAQVLALQEHVKRTIAPYKYPRVIKFVASLPRTETGKLQRFRLKTS